jgi:hypothetical protein
MFDDIRRTLINPTDLGKLVAVACIVYRPHQCHNRPPDEYEPLMNEDEMLTGTVRAFANLLEILMTVRLQESTPSITPCIT